jgi:hypothetical protein
VTAAPFTILDAMDAPAIWGGWFRDRKTWVPWRGFLAALFGLPLSGGDLALFQQCTGRAVAPVGGFTEAWLICGRRAGKSFILALIACFLAIFRDWKPYLAPGEIGTIKIIATDRRQARVIHRYCRALLTKVPAFAEFIQHDSDDEIALTNGVTIEVQTANFRSVRGFTLIAVLADEIAFWRTDEDSASPDAEIIGALRPAMATVRGAFFLAASSPYARRGELWNAFRRWYGDDDAPALIWRAPTALMNPTVPAATIDAALEEDPARAAAEFLAEFRVDIETFVSREVVEAAVVPDRRELPHVPGTRYVGFVDPSGAAVDSMTLAISHRDRDGIVLDAVREVRPPFSPEAVVTEFAAVLKGYHTREVTGDRWGGEWPREQFQKNGIKYIVSERVKSQIYLEFLPLLNSNKVELLDNPRLTSQLCGLERRTGRGTGRDVVDHSPGGHDDIVNSAAGAVVLAATEAGPLVITAALLAAARRPDPRHADPYYGRSPRLMSRPSSSVIGMPYSVNYSEFKRD